MSSVFLFIQSHWYSWLKSSLVFILGFSAGSFLFRQTQKAFEMKVSVEKPAELSAPLEQTPAIKKITVLTPAVHKKLSIAEAMQVLLQPYSQKQEIEARQKLAILQTWQKRQEPLPLIVKPLLMQLALSPKELWAVKREAAFSLTQSFFWNSEKARNDFVLKLDPKIRNTLFYSQRQLVGKILESQ